MASDPIAFHSLEDPLEKIVEPDTSRNAADILCPLDKCKCLVIKKGAAVLVERDGAKLELPESVLGSNLSEQLQGSAETQFWRLGNMMDFENVGFSKTVDAVKYLSCADCDVGPIGYHDTKESPSEFLISIRRARYRF
ncbi:Mss4-like protein [Zychaea mexicana]|uniref:Mss4-like protein n=1 Tax=Zychaea mexicana TaxID=64656 RepID=UPI0022FF036D|nr:Mss4-like protein [Zychaea mexicana]KAI9493704.1 Mss4-like protein [Zychaea mexicana]